VPSAPRTLTGTTVHLECFDSTNEVGLACRDFKLRDVRGRDLPAIQDAIRTSSQRSGVEGSV